MIFCRKSVIVVDHCCYQVQEGTGAPFRGTCPLRAPRALMTIIVTHIHTYTHTQHINTPTTTQHMYEQTCSFNRISWTYTCRYSISELCIYYNLYVYNPSLYSLFCTYECIIPNDLQFQSYRMSVDRLKKCQKFIVFNMLYRHRSIVCGQYVHANDEIASRMILEY